ncbi:hypothetical protein N7493_009342 [Penicillium malachiteum]|uniref:Uncharacterized protein n=1 Tax=Penicillium malachiteum TaxID=1324776 RepID=A0AAD6HFI1_9EURO|nr:hypothetical protein N7493_009342 [Penicillium malachiteum]
MFEQNCPKWGRRVCVEVRSTRLFSLSQLSTSLETRGVGGDAFLLPCLTDPPLRFWVSRGLVPESRNRGDFVLQRQPASTAVVNTHSPSLIGRSVPPRRGSADALCERSWWAATPNVFHPRRCSYRKSGARLGLGIAGVCGRMAAGHTRHLDSRRKLPCGIRRSPASSTGSAPPPEGRMAQPIPAREGDPGSDSCDRTGAEGLSGGNWMVVRVAPGTPGRQWPAGRSSRPFLIFELSPPSGVLGRDGWASAHPARPRR